MLREIMYITRGDSEIIASVVQLYTKCNRKIMPCNIIVKRYNNYNLYSFPPNL